jgi:hypothetical protein
MTYTVITKAGFIYVFYIKATADCYVSAYGGVIFTDEIFTKVTA